MKMTGEVARKLMVTSAAALVSAALLATQASAQGDQGRGSNRGQSPGSMQMRPGGGGGGRAEPWMRGGGANAGMSAQTNGMRAGGRADAGERTSVRASGRVDTGERGRIRSRSDSTRVSVRGDRRDFRDNGFRRDRTTFIDRR